MRKKVGIIKRVFSIGLIFLLSINSFAAIVSDNDGSAFITKSEFDALKSSFQSQIDSYNNSIDSKIDGAIASYLAGIKLSSSEERTLNCANTINTIGIKNYGNDILEWKDEKSDIINMMSIFKRTQVGWSGNNINIGTSQISFLVANFADTDDPTTYKNLLLNFENGVCTGVNESYRYILIGGMLAVQGNSTYGVVMSLHNLQPTYDSGVVYPLASDNFTGGLAQTGGYVYGIGPTTPAMEDIAAVLGVSYNAGHAGYPAAEAYAPIILCGGTNLGEKPAYFSSSDKTTKVLYQNINSDFRILDTSYVTSSTTGNWTGKKRWVNNSLFLRNSSSAWSDVPPTYYTEIIWPKFYFQSNDKINYNTFTDEVALQNVKCSYNYKTGPGGNVYFTVKDGIYLLTPAEGDNAIEFDVKFDTAVKFGIGLSGFDKSLTNQTKLIPISRVSGSSTTSAKVHTLSANTQYTFKIDNVPSLADTDLFFSWVGTSTANSGTINYISAARVTKES